MIMRIGNRSKRSIRPCYKNRIRMTMKILANVISSIRLQDNKIRITIRIRVWINKSNIMILFLLTNMFWKAKMMNTVNINRSNRTINWILLETIETLLKGNLLIIVIRIAKENLKKKKYNKCLLKPSYYSSAKIVSNNWSKRTKVTRLSKKASTNVSLVY